MDRLVDSGRRRVNLNNVSHLKVIELKELDVSDAIYKKERGNAADDAHNYMPQEGAQEPACRRPSREVFMTKNEKRKRKIPAGEARAV